MNRPLSLAALGTGCLLASCATTRPAPVDALRSEPVAATTRYAVSAPSHVPAPGTSSSASALGAYGAAASAVTAAASTAEASAPALPAASPSFAQDDEVYSQQEGDWEFTLGGSGSNDQDFDVGGGSMAGSVGYFLSDHSELGVRQSVSFSDFGDSIWNGSTRVFYDYHFGEGPLRPLLGVNFGWVYGDTVDETLAAAPEAGLKWFVTPEAFVFGLAEYQFFFEDTDEADDAFEDGSFVYTFGIGFAL